MTVLIDDGMAVDIQDLGQEIVDLMQAKRDEITLNLGLPVVWTNDERLLLMKAITLVAYLEALDLACYPLSVAAVVFFP